MDYKNKIKKNVEENVEKQKGFKQGKLNFTYLYTDGGYNFNVNCSNSGSGGRSIHFFY